MVDIKMNEMWQLTPAATGDAPVTDDTDGLLQTLQIEALTQDGELFYDEDFGWSLLDFMQAEESDLTKIEIEKRIKTKIAAHDEIIQDSVTVQQDWSIDALTLFIRFKLTDDETEHTMSVSLDRVKVVIS